MHYYIFVSLNGQGAITKSELTAALWQDEGLDWEAKDLKWGQHKINKMELKPGDLQHFHVIKEEPFFGVPHTHQTLSGKSACWTEVLWSMHIAWGIIMRRSMFSFRATILLESWRLSEMADTTGGSRLFRRDRPRRWAEAGLYVREWLECTELCLRFDDEPSESLWVRLKE